MRSFVTLAKVLVPASLLLAGACLDASAQRTGEQIVKARCATCHQDGLYGAPRIDDRAAWIPRLKNGLDATVGSAIKGHGAMPSRGGLSDLTDAEMRSAVIHLFNSAGPLPAPPPTAALGPNERLVDGTQIFLGIKELKTGLFHVTVTLRDSATNLTIDDAQVEVRVTNPVRGTEERQLARVAIDRTVSYANDFRMTGKEPHVLTVQVRRPGSLRLIETKFDFRG